MRRPKEEVKINDVTEDNLQMLHLHTLIIKNLVINYLFDFNKSSHWSKKHLSK